MRKELEHLANGDFQNGLTKLNTDDQWRDETDTLEGPLDPRFPDAAGWREQLPAASLLKRHAAVSNRPIKIWAVPQVCSILRHDRAFLVEPIVCKDERPVGVRSPLTILRHALTGDLLNLPFVPVGPGATLSPSGRSKPRIGIAWESRKNFRSVSCETSIPLEKFLGILQDVKAEVVSLQHNLHADERATLQARFPGRCAVTTDATLDAENQTALVKEICDLDCMVTISTTTAHMAACLGIPVVLLAATQSGYQWFWRAQREHGKCCYPSVGIILGTSGASWWADCLDSAHQQLARHVTFSEEKF